MRRTLVLIRGKQLSARPALQSRDVPVALAKVGNAEVVPGNYSSVLVQADDLLHTNIIQYTPYGVLKASMAANPNPLRNFALITTSAPAVTTELSHLGNLTPVPFRVDSIASTNGSQP